MKGLCRAARRCLPFCLLVASKKNEGTKYHEPIQSRGAAQGEIVKFGCEDSEHPPSREAAPAGFATGGVKHSETSRPARV
jgi:hypothetical protein